LRKLRIFLCCWSETKTISKAKELEEAGYIVAFESFDGGLVYKTIKTTPSDVVVIDLDEKPSHGRETARAIRSNKSTREIPIIFVGGDEENKLKTAERIPNSAFTSWSSIKSILTKF